MSGPQASQRAGFAQKHILPPQCRKVPQMQHRLSAWADSIALSLSVSLSLSLSVVPFRDHLATERREEKAPWIATDLVTIASLSP